MATKRVRAAAKKPRRQTVEGLLTAEQKEWYEARVDQYNRENGTTASLEDYIREVSPRLTEINEDALAKLRQELEEARVKLAAAERECELARHRLAAEKKRAVEAEKVSEGLRDLYLHETEASGRNRAEADEFKKRWEEAWEFAAKQTTEVSSLRTTVGELTAKFERFCSDCRSEGVLYMFQGKAYCSACLARRRPPMTYEGPERRKTQVPGIWRRRATDSSGKKPGGR